jgi:predicted nucleic acid-binding protein
VIVLDTNVASELMLPAPSATVTAWVRARSAAELYTTSITLAEILYGIERIPEGRRKDQLKAATAEVFSAFSDHVLAFDAAAAEEYAGIVGERDRMGAPIDGFDAQIASICRARDVPLATRNVRDFRGTGIDVIDPWSENS